MKLTIQKLRSRHLACVSWADIKRAIDAGDVPYKPAYGPSCSFPEDGICAHPLMPDDEVRRLMEEKNV